MEQQPHAGLLTTLARSPMLLIFLQSSSSFSSYCAWVCASSNYAFAALTASSDACSIFWAAHLIASAAVRLSSARRTAREGLMVPFFWPTTWAAVMMPLLVSC